MATVTQPQTFLLKTNSELSASENLERIIRYMQHIIENCNDYTVQICFNDEDNKMDAIEMLELVSKSTEMAKTIAKDPYMCAQLGINNNNDE